jgi:SPP1 gp7 family putative phage head morphogenesis protein
MAELFDIVVRRQIYIEGLKHAKANEWSARLADLRRELATRLNAVSEDLGDMTKTAIRKLIVDLKTIAKTKFDAWLTDLIDWLKQFVGDDYDMLTRLFRPHGDDVAQRELDDDQNKDHWTPFVAVPVAATGTLALPFLLALAPSAMVKLDRLVTAAWVQQQKRDELKRAIVGVSKENTNDAIQQLERQAIAATNTVLQHLTNQTSNSIGAKIAGFYEWVSVLDNKTTEICISRDGNRYPYGQGPIPPAHINCRSTIVPVGIDDPATPNSFAEWVASQPFDFVKDALYGQRNARYDRTPAIDLSAYVGKFDLIGLP